MPINDFNDMMVSTVIYRSLLRRDDYGKPEYNEGLTYLARIIDKSVLVRDSQGQEVNADGSIILNGTPVIIPNSQLELPDGSTPVVIRTKRAYDENGPHHTRVYFGTTNP